MQMQSETLLKPAQAPAFFIGGLGGPARLGLVGFLLLAGAAVQVFAFAPAGALLILAAVALAVPRGVTNKPAAIKDSGSWERVTGEELSAAFRLDEQARKWSRCPFGVNSMPGFLLMLLACAAAAAAVIAVAAIQGGLDFEHVLLAWSPGFRAEILLADAALFFIPVWVSGLRATWSPPDLLVKLAALHNVISRTREFPEPGMEACPMLRIGRTDRGLVPLDARLMLMWPQGPPEFIGLQVQVSINKVQNAAYPYLYAVVVARKGKLGLAGAGIDSVKDVCEFDGNDSEADVLVIRQRTSRNSGYHTKEKDQIRVFEVAMATAKSVLKPSA